MMNPSTLLLLLLLLPPSLSTITTFTFTNKCQFTVWPAALSNSGLPPLSPSSFELPSASSLSLPSPSGWSGRFWARTGCLPNNTSSCATGQTPPATLAEFSLSASDPNGTDFYDVSLVDGFNLPMLVQGGNGRCRPTGCAADLNESCPPELRFGSGDAKACRSACDVFRRPEYCCSGDFASPAKCRPTPYSELFKAACPKSYSYAFDDSTSTFTCAAAGEFTVTFCPDPSQSKKSSKDPPISPKTPAISPKTSGGGLMIENDSWLASLATGSANTKKSVAISPLLSFIVFCSASILFLLRA